MKKIFYLMISVAVAIAAASCEKDKTGDDTVLPVEGTVPASAVAGSDVTVGGSFLAGDKFYMLKEKDSQEGRIDLKASKLLESGVIVKLSYHTGKYFMYVDRDGNANLLGEIKVEITGLSVPESAVAGEEISISGNGFNPAGKLFAKPAEGDDIDLNSSYADGVVTATLPANMTAGTYSLYYQQETDCNYTLTESFVVSEPVVEGKKLAAFSIPLLGMTYTITYTEDGLPETVDENPVTIDGDKYSYEALGFDFNTGNYLMATYTIEVKDDKVNTISANGVLLDMETMEPLPDTYESLIEFKYDNQGHMTMAGEYEFLWENGNYSSDVVYDSASALKNHPNAKYDPIMLLDASMEVPEIIPAILLGFGGTPSKELPTQFAAGMNDDGSIAFEAIEYVFDEDGYLKSMTMGETMLSLEFVYAE